MREIKFRAWNELTKEMWRHFMINTDGEIVLETEDGDQQICSNNDANPLHLMQYTGLKDKNGKEIYEGDILTDNIVIAWHDNLASFCLNKKGWMFPHFFKETLDPDTVEIIGNIYENPELLDAKEK